MQNLKLTVSQAAAALAVVLALLNDTGLVANVGVDPMVTGLSALILAATAFVLSLTRGSTFVAGALTLQGAANMLASANAGVTVGVAFGLVVLVLGLAEGGTAWRSTKKRPAAPAAQ